MKRVPGLAADSCGSLSRQSMPTELSHVINMEDFDVQST